MNIHGMSVLTLVKNRPMHLARLIDGLRRSEVAPVELLVVDMGGGWSPPVPCGFPIRVISMPSDGLPLARARNAAAAAATSANLLFLDVDCIPMRNLVSSMTHHATRTDGVICAPVHYLGRGEMLDEWDERSLLAVARSHPVRHFPDSGLRQETNAGLFWSLTFAIRRTLFFDLGGFDEAFHGYGAEDTDFGFRAKNAGVDLYFSGGAGAFHQYHEVFDPPLQHFHDIVANAMTFHRKWNVWPMQGWLDSFTSMGLIDVQPAEIRVTRAPTTDEIAGARRQTRY